MHIQNNQPLVSIIIPSFNAEKFLAETIQSALDQTWPTIEIIIVDDSSTDQSLILAKQYQQQYPEKITIYKNPGKGACAARNYGFQKSQGEYIQFLDADDLLSPAKIELQVEVLQQNPNYLAVCETWYFYNTIEDAHNTDRPYLFSTTQPEVFFIQLWGGKELSPNMVQTSAWLTPRSLIDKNGGWDESLSKDQDGEFFARLGLNSEGIAYVPNIKNYYQKHIKGNNIASQKKRVQIESILKATDLKAQYLLNKSQKPSALLAIATQYKWMAIEAWPQFKDLTINALSKSHQFGGSSFVPVLGGKSISLIQKAFGWKMAKGFSYYVHKII